MSGFHADAVLSGQFDNANLSGSGASHSVDGGVQARELFNFASGVENNLSIAPTYDAPGVK
jgi:hypothetical protein